MGQPADLDKILLEAVDEGLLVPSEIVLAAIFDRMERSYQPKLREIPEKLETLHLALEDLLGKGARVMEKLIAKNLYNHLGLNFTQHDGWTPVNRAKEMSIDA